MNSALFGTPLNNVHHALTQTWNVPEGYNQRHQSHRRALGRWPGHSAKVEQPEIESFGLKLKLWRAINNSDSFTLRPRFIVIIIGTDSSLTIKIFQT